MLGPLPASPESRQHAEDPLPLAIHSGDPLITDPFPGWPIQDGTERARVQAALESGTWGVGGECLAEFSRRFAEFQQAGHVLPVANGTVAIEMALEALGLGLGDEVIVPDYTFVATATAPMRLGIRPVLVDVRPDTFTIDPAAVEAAVTERTRAVIPVHFGGNLCDMEATLLLADRYGLAVVEDCAHAHGAHLDGRYAGSFGEVGTFSFQSSKTLCCGEGGAVVTRSERLLARMRAIHSAGRHGSEDDYNHFTLGSNYRLSELQAALLLAQMSRLEELCDRRDRHGALLNERLSAIDGVRPQERQPGLGRHGHYLFPFVVEADVPRDAFKRALRAEGVPVEDQYPALHEVVCLRNSGLAEGEFPVSAELSARSVWIFHHALLAGEDQVGLIADAVSKVLDHRGELV